MGIISVIKPALFFYEAVRVVILALVLMFLLPGTSAVPWLAIASPGALFPLMSLFLWIDIIRYKAYLPLYLAGKYIGIFTIIIFSLISRRLTVINVSSDSIILTELFFLCGDILAAAGIHVINRKLHKIETAAEEKQCG
ncbi:MAG: hypothetical protein FWC19_01715 [Treponema sp.]|nr:hypothetical protein [Treponema sp.]MCL2271509.1 hypothetical protein [Treponema sp.]